MRRHLSYANVVATLALVFAMSGGALAAKHYLLTSTEQVKPSVLKQLHLLTSTKQIKPSVLKQLRGVTGPAGAVGASGAAGQRGETGPPGPSGATEGTPVEQRSGATILSDPDVGLRVVQDSSFFDFRFFNTNSSVPITINGVVETLGEKVDAWQVQLEPGESAVSPSNAAQTRFVDVAVVRNGETLASSPIVHVTCGIASQGAAPSNCLASR